MKEETLKFTGRIIAGAYYDFQQVRIETLNRVRDIIRKKNEGISFTEVEEKKEKTKKQEKQYSDSELLNTLEKLKQENKLTKKEYDYLNKTLETAEKSKALENSYKTLMKKYIETEPIYQEFLGHIRGLGPVLSANLIKELGYCEIPVYVSQVWSYCGFNVVNGLAVRRKKNQKLGFNMKLKTMSWKIGDSFIKQRTPYYRDIYDSEKERQLSITYKRGELFNKYKDQYAKGKCPYKPEDTKLKLIHAHNRALRKMVKHFLSHYWACARELKGLEVTKPYQFEKLGHKSFVSWRDVVKLNLIKQ